MQVKQEFVYSPVDLSLTGQNIQSDPDFKVLKQHRNYWLELGTDEAAVEQRIRELWHSLLHDPEKGFALQTAEDEACFYDTGNNDVRTEGQSYAMVLAVILGDKVFFDNVWRWSLRHMYLTEGPCRGYFAWSVPLDGRPRANGPAPDGEEFFIWALTGADERWGSQGNAEDPLNYAAWAERILHDVLHRETGEAKPLWQDNNLIAFVPGCGFTDPSYHIPHAYERFAEYAPAADRERWYEIAKASRDYLPLSAHLETGLFPEYAHNDGTPELAHGHGNFYSDAYRCMLNIAGDAIVSGTDSWHETIAANQARFFAEMPEDAKFARYELDGTPTGELSLHPVGLQATIACTFAVIDNAHSRKLATQFMDLELRGGDRRYYDNLLFIFSYLTLAGKYSI